MSALAHIGILVAWCVAVYVVTRWHYRLAKKRIRTEADMAAFAAGVSCGVDFADTHDPDEGYGEPTDQWVQAEFEDWRSRR